MRRTAMEPRGNKVLKSDREDKSSSRKSKGGDRNSVKTKSRDHGSNLNKYVPPKGPFKKTPNLKDVKQLDMEKIVREKILNCSILLNFDDPKTIEARDTKYRNLLEIMDFIGTIHGSLPEYIYSDITYLFGCNVFRTLDPYHPVLSVGIEDEDDYQLLEQWPHLQYIYEIFLKVIEHPEFDNKKAKRFIDNVFIKLLLDIFDSPDPRERDYLKTILHRIYGKMISLRSFIRKQINNIFFTFIYETDRHNGVAELLEILGSIINGFQIPIKDEHKKFLKHVLLPLHKPKCLSQYHPQLAYCITEFIKKDIKLMKCIIVEGLIRFWPKMHSIKELMFLNELEECLELCDREQFKVIMEPLFRQLSRCVSSPNFQVCERTLYLWTNTDIVDLMTPNVRQILPIIFPSLYNSKQHWNKSIHSMVFNALKVMMDMDQSAFDDFTSKFKEERNKDKEHLKHQAEIWRRISIKARKNPLHNSYSESLSLSSYSQSENRDVEKSLKNIGVEIKRHSSSKPEQTITQKITVPKAQAAVARPNVKTSSKDSYSFKN